MSTGPEPAPPPPPGPIVPPPVVVPLPGPDPTTALPPEILDVRPFVRYDVTGRITEAGKMGLAFILGEKIQGVRIVEGDGVGREGTHWVDDEDGVPELVERPVFETELEVEIEAFTAHTITDLPACTIRFTGPLVGEHVHEGGDCEIGFMVPGQYVLTFEAFPYRGVTVVMEVTA